MFGCRGCGDPLFAVVVLVAMVILVVFVVLVLVVVLVVLIVLLVLASFPRAVTLIIMILDFKSFRRKHKRAVS